MAVAFVNYLIGILIDRYPAYSRIFVGAGIIFSIMVLGYYRYTRFFLFNVNKYFHMDLSIPEIVRPIGLSFYIFQGLSYIIDVYRYKNNRYQGNEKLCGCPVQKNFFKLLLYISLFPQLIAGPIVRYKQIEKQIEQRSYSWQQFSYGIERFIWGLAKKVAIADTLAIAADKIFLMDESYLSFSVAWIGAICYTLQIYFDFSGYSDMAIGLGKLFGFTFSENFDAPYHARSITEFWRRWHISLSSWFRDYVYIPLGGSKKGNVYVHLFIVFVLTGIWHGASWNFIAWGIVYACFIVMERFVMMKIKMPKLPVWVSPVRRIYTLLIVIFQWVMFRGITFHKALSYWKTMVGLRHETFQPFAGRYYLNNQTIFILVLAVLLTALPFQKWVSRFREHLSGEIVVKGLNVIVLLICLLMIINNDYSPFIYFQF